MPRIITLIQRTTTFLQEAEAEYEKIDKDSNIRRAFYEAGKGLTLVKTTLEHVKPHFQNLDLSEDCEEAKKSIKACELKARSSLWVFSQVALAPKNSRFRAYQTLLAQEGKKYIVEVLVQEMMEHVCELAKQSGIKEEMKDDLEDLCDAIDAFKDMVASAPEEEKSSYVFFGEGDQFNAAGLAEQNNNPGYGNQFPNAIFNQEVHVGKGAQGSEKQPGGGGSGTSD